MEALGSAGATYKYAVDKATDEPKGSANESAGSPQDRGRSHEMHAVERNGTTQFTTTLAQER